MLETNPTGDLPFSSHATANWSDRVAASSDPERIGAYRVIRELGKGGMGVVYHAEQENPRRAVAVKVIHPAHFSRESILRFEREAGLLGRFQHPGIAQIIEAGAAQAGTAAQPYIVMELVDGQPLTSYAKARGLDVPGRVRLMMEVCDAVQHAHQKGVIHRDLKPGNVLVDGAGRPKILDFGLARLSAEEPPDEPPMSLPGQPMGTLPYMSPEQAAGDRDALDVRTDVYALGATLYELLAGRHPIDLYGRDLAQALDAVRRDEPQPLGRGHPHLRGDLEAIVAKCLEKEPARRYGTVAALADDLARYLNHEPVRARPASGLYRARKFVRRHRGAVVGTVSLALGLAAFLGSLGWGHYQAALQRRELQVRDLDRGRAALRQGEWRAAKDALDTALARASRHPRDADSQQQVLRSAAFWLDRIRALDGLSDAPAACNALADLRRRISQGEIEPSPEEAGEILIRRADLAPGTDAGRSVETLIQGALKGKLRPEHEAYARGLLAPTARQAAEHFGAAWRDDRFLFRARLGHVLALILKGEPERARELVVATESLFPDDANAKALHAVVLALLGRDDEARSAAELLRRAGKAGQFRIASAAVDRIARARRDTTEAIILDSIDMLVGTSGIQQLASLPAMPAYITAYRDALGAGAPLDVRALLGKADRAEAPGPERIAALERAEAIIPHGASSYFLILEYIDINNYKKVEEIAVGLFKRPCLHVGTRDEVAGTLMLALLRRVGFDPGDPELARGITRRVIVEGVRSHPDRDLAAATSRQLRTYLVTPEIMQGIPEAYFAPMSQVCWFTGDFETSQQFLMAGLVRFPNSQRIREELDRVEAAIGRPDAILRAADAYERDDPRDPVVPKLREKARIVLAELQRTRGAVEQKRPSRDPVATK